MVDLTVRTNFFAHSWGVFEGGGVRGAALAGAYEAANKAGIKFSRVAGTSAGSIVAALIAAGAKPDFILEKLYEKDFVDFLQTSVFTKSIFENQIVLLRFLKLFRFKSVKNILSLILNSGMYSSESLEIWVEGLLKELLISYKPEISKRPVLFRDLPLPLHIVASDLVQASPKIWSKEMTPEESVAWAVRCSCTIPFFFQAIESGGSIYVDGGILSNLPSFVFSKLADPQARSVLSRVLCFRITETQSNSKHKISNILDFALRLSDTVINGATQIQLILQPDIHIIEINTGEIKSTDFDIVGRKQKEELRNYGYQKVQNFIRHERQYLQRKAQTLVYKGFDEKCLLIVQKLQNCRDSVWISDSDTYWIYFIFLSFLSAARRGIKIILITQKTNDDDEFHRRWLMKQIGAEIYEIEAISFNGFLFDFTQETGLALISYKEKSGQNDLGYKDETTKVYSNSLDIPIIKNFSNLLIPYRVNPKPNNIQKEEFTFQPYNPEFLFNQLREVPQYKYAKFSLTDIEINDELLIMQRLVKEFKLIQINQFIEDLKSSGIELFYPQRIIFLDGTYTIVTPPVLERLGDKFIVIEGLTRLFYCLQNNYKTMKVIVVEDVQDPLPGKPISITDINLTSGTFSVDEMIQEYDRSLYRYIERKLHPYPPFRIPSLEK